MFKKTTHILLVATLAFGAIVGGFFLNTRDYEKVSAVGCGDGVIDGTDECDDGGTIPDDGCSATCTIESGYACIGEPSSCQLNEGITTSAGIGNLSPVFTVAPSDGGSDTTNPTNVGDDITFTATATDVNTDQYYLLLCSGWGTFPPGDDSAPVCIDTDMWGVSSATNSGAQATATYTTQLTDNESNQWYAYVCDKLPTSSGPACSLVAGDQGSAVGTITFTGIPADGDNITVNSVTYEFDTNASYTNTRVDISSALSIANVTSALVSAEAGVSSHMASRGTVVYVYADSAGTAGNSIAMTENLDTNGYIALSGATLTGGSDSNASPFIVNHAPTFGTVTVTDTSGGEINPGDTLRFTLPNAQIDDTDSSGSQDTIDMYICQTAGFTYGATPACTGTEVCHDSAVDPTSEDATCDETGNNLVPPTDTGGSENFYVYVQDSHDFYDSGATNLQSYTITNTAPTHDTPELSVHMPVLPNSVINLQFEDGNSATNFDDETINGNNGTSGGTSTPTWTEEGYIGGAYSFDDLNDYIGVLNNDTLQYTGENMTISLWAKINSSEVGGSLFSKPWNGGGGYNYILSYLSNQTLSFSLAGATTSNITSIGTVSKDVWHLITITVDSDKNVKLYIDGAHNRTVVHTITSWIPPAGDSELPLAIGTLFPYGYGWAGNAGHALDGFVDEFHIYDRALTADEIAQQYAAYAGAPETDLVSYWKLDESTAIHNSTLSDSVGSNDGTLTTNNGSTEKSVTGYYGKAVDLDGTDDYIDTGNIFATSQTDLTVSAWVNVDSFNTHGSSAISTPFVSNWNTWAPGTQKGYLLRAFFNYVDGNPAHDLMSWQFIVADGTNYADCSTSEIDYTSFNTLYANQWLHFTGVFDGSTSTKLYLNGNEIASCTSGILAQMSPDTAGSNWIGRTDINAGYLNGTIDEVRIYNTPLSATEVQQLYYASKYHDSNQDLSCKVGNVDDHDSDSTTTIFNWLKDDTSTTLLNMPFDSEVTDETADAVLDYSENGNYGTLGGGNSDYVPMWTSSGVKGGAYDFDGTDDYIGYGDVLDQTTNDFSLSAWIKTDTTASYPSIISKRITGDPWDGYRLWIHGNCGPGIPSGILNDIDTAGDTHVCASTAVNDGVWHYIVATFDRDSVTGGKIYIDGVLENSGVDITSQSSSLANAGSFNIGNGSTLANPFDGLIDEVRVYNTALSAEQIAQNYNNGKPLYNTIVNQETDEANESWQCRAIVNDAQSSNADSTPADSNLISPNNSAPVQNFPSTRVHALLDANSVGYWQFEGGDLTSNILDETTNSNNGSCGQGTCPTWTVEGAVGGGYEFDGVNDYVEVSDSTSLDISGSAVSVSAWIKPDSIHNGQVIMKSNTVTTDIPYGFQIYDDGNIYIHITTTGGTGWQELNIGNYTPGVWQHVALTYNGTTLRGYIDGAQTNSNPHTGTIVTNNDPLWIGGDAGGWSFDGMIDEIHIYDRALSATEIANLYNSTSYIYGSMDLGVGTRDGDDADDDDLYATVDWRESDTSIAVLNMSFNEDVTTTTADAVTDYSSYGNNGTLGGGTASAAPTWTNAVTCGNNSGGCYDFDGTNDYIETGLSSSSDASHPVTLEAWVNTTDTGTIDPIIGKSGDGRIDMWRNYDDLRCRGYNFSDYSAYGTTDINDGNWHHVVCVFDSNGITAYVDGNQEGSHSSPTSTGASVMYIGETGSTTPTGSFDGMIDEVKIYDRALSTEQISANYNAGKPNYQNIAYGTTSVGETWKSLSTLTEGNSESSVTLESNEVEILGFSVDVTEKWNDTHNEFWHAQDSGLTAQLPEVYFVNSNVGWLNGGTGGIRKTVDGGLTWTDQTGAANKFYFYDINTGWAVSNNDYIIHTTNGGFTWTSQTSPTSGIHLQGVHFVDDQIGYIVGDGGTILKTINGGSTWTAQTSNTTNALYDVHCYDANTCWAVGASGTVVYTSNGTSWSTQTPSPIQYYYEISCVDANNCWAVGANGGLTHTSNGGTNWSAQTSGLATTTLNDVHFFDTNNGWIAAHNGNILKTTNGGTNWDTVISGAGTNALRALHCVDANNCWIVGDNGTLLKGGWQVDSSGTHPTHAGEDVIFKGNFNTAGNQYYLAVCKTDAVTVGNDAAPTCDGGSWDISSATTDNAEVTATYTTSSSDPGNNIWYAFACTKEVGGGTCSPSTQGSGNSGSPFVVNHGPVFIDEIEAVDYASGTELLIDGDMEDAGTSAWTALNSATLTKETPFLQSQLLRIAYNTVANPYAYQTILTTGKMYRVTGYGRSDGTALPRVLEGTTELWTGTTSTESQYFNLSFEASDTSFYIGSSLSSSGYAEFDNVSVVEVGVEPGDRLTFEFRVGDENGNDVTAVVCDSAGFNDTTKTCNSEEICRLSTETTWTAQTSGVATQLNAVTVFDSNEAWAAGDGGVIRYTADGGATSWTSQTSGTTNDLNAIVVANEYGDELYAVGDGGVIRYTDDGGATSWTSQTSGTTNDLYDAVIQSGEGAIGWIVGASGTIRFYNGSTWTAQTSAGTSENLYGVGWGDQGAWAVGSNGVMFYNTDVWGGDTWVTATSGTSAQLNDVFFYSIYNVSAGWVVGNGGTILKTTDGGTTWVAKSSGTSENLEDVHFVNELVGWVSGANGTVLYTSDGGESWSVQTTPNSNNLMSVYFPRNFAYAGSSINDGWAVGASGTILKADNLYSDSRLEWTHRSTGYSTYYDLNAAYMASTEIGWLVGEKQDDTGLIMKTTDGGETWTTQTNPASDMLTDIDCLDVNNCWAVGQTGSITKTTDGGTNWTNENYSSTNYYAVDFISSTVGWIGGQGGVISKTIDGGDNWTTQTTPTSQYIQDIIFLDANTGYAVGNVGTILKTTNGGTNWTSQSVDSYTFSAISCIDANTCWIGGQSGKFRKTTDGGANWNLITNTPNTSEIYDIYFMDANKGWVMTQNWLYYTRDGGNTWIFEMDPPNSNAGGGFAFADELHAIAVGNAGQTWNGVGGVEITCNETDTDPNDSDGNPVYVGIPQVHDVDGTYANSPTANRYTVHLFDAHNLEDDGTSENQFIEVQDVPPYIDDSGEYTVDNITLTAGFYTDKTYTVTVKDDNGDTDLVDTTTGYLYDSNATSLTTGACTPDELNCYTDSICSLSNNTSGTDNTATATCAFTNASGNPIWFNANTSTTWKLHVNPVDGQGAVTNQVDSGDIEIGALAAINIVETSIAYGSIELGRSSAGQTATIENLGNQTFDLTVQGDDMCTDYPTCSGATISKVWQKYHNTNSDFNWNQEGSALVGTPLSGCTPASNCNETHGCVNRDIGVRSVHGTASTDENFYLKILIPSDQTPGSYTGQNTIGTTADDSCVGTLY